MKNAGFFLVMMAFLALSAMILSGADAFARQSSSAPESTSSSSRDAAIAHPSSDSSPDNQIGDAKSAGDKNSHARNSLLPAKKNPLPPASRRPQPKAPAPNPAHSTSTTIANKPTMMPAENNSSHPNGLAPPVSTSAVNRHSIPAPSPAIAANAQQIKRSHDPGAHLAVSGGPANSTHGTAAISGTNMKRKP
jgi:hypothetical protein